MFYLTFHTWIGDRGAAMKLLDAHLAWMRDQQRTGNIIAAGPTPDRETGIVLLRHMNRGEVDVVLGSDPFVAGGHRTYEVMEWDAHHVLGVGGFDRATVMAMTQADEAHTHTESVSQFRTV